MNKNTYNNNIKVNSSVHEKNNSRKVYITPRNSCPAPCRASIYAPTSIATTSTMTSREPTNRLPVGNNYSRRKTKPNNLEYFTVIQSDIKSQKDNAAFNNTNLLNANTCTETTCVNLKINLVKDQNNFEKDVCTRETCPNLIQDKTDIDQDTCTRERCPNLKTILLKNSDYDWTPYSPSINSLPRETVKKDKSISTKDNSTITMEMKIMDDETQNNQVPVKYLKKPSSYCDTVDYDCCFADDTHSDIILFDAPPREDEMKISTHSLYGQNKSAPSDVSRRKYPPDSPCMANLQASMLKNNDENKSVNTYESTSSNKKSKMKRETKSMKTQMLPSSEKKGYESEKSSATTTSEKLSKFNDESTRKSVPKQNTNTEKYIKENRGNARLEKANRNGTASVFKDKNDIALSPKISECECSSTNVKVDGVKDKKTTWALTKITVNENGLKLFEIIEESDSPPGHFFLKGTDDIYLFNSRTT